MCHIWTDPWIPNGETRRPRTVQGNQLLTKVDELLDPVSGTWDEVLVRQTFVAADADIFLRIPVCEYEEDHIAWHFDEKGRFSVKSAYKLHSVLVNDFF